MKYFAYLSGSKMFNAEFCNLFGNPARSKESEITQFYKDVAASIQKVTEKAVLNLAQRAMEIAGSKNLCLSGGVALNCVANGEVLQKLKPEGLWIQPASGDAGGALGAALAYFYSKDSSNRNVLSGDSMKNALLGPELSANEIETVLNNVKAVYKRHTREDRIRHSAERLAKGQSIGWFQGRMEFGPRALGNRSILADPRGADMQKELNLKIKFRESFRPFAPIILKEKANQYFINSSPSPYMMLTFDTKKDVTVLPATTHVDGSSRVQTVDETTNPDLNSLLLEFEKITGCPALVNTSFNVRGEPIVCSPFDAWRCFMSTGLDVLVIGDFILEKKDQDPALLMTRSLQED
jgi:carbamoyltransferase